MCSPKDVIMQIFSLHFFFNLKINLSWSLWKLRKHKSETNSNEIWPQHSNCELPRAVPVYHLAQFLFKSSSFICYTFNIGKFWHFHCVKIEVMHIYSDISYNVNILVDMYFFIFKMVTWIKYLNIAFAPGNT